MAARVLERPGLLTVEQWRAYFGREHHYQFHPSQRQKKQVVDLAGLLDVVTGSAQHVHVCGHAGVGKTRLVLETCAGSEWSDLVVYVPEASDQAKRILAELALTDARAVVVVDETPAAEVIHYARSAGLSEGRVRVVTIGTTDPGGNEIQNVVALSPHTADEADEVARLWWPELSSQHRMYVVRMADGYLRLLRILGDHVVAHPTVTTTALLAHRTILPAIRNLLPEYDPRHLYVLSVLQYLGFAGPLEAQGQLVAAALGVEWKAVKQTALTLRDRHGLVRTGQNLLYMSPRPLALSLAHEAWDRFPEDLRRLRDQLPDEAVKALDRRLAEIGGGPAGSALFRRELGRFRGIDDFADEKDARLWTVLAEGQPFAAVEALRLALDAATESERRKLGGAARRTLVWYLPKLAWAAETFDSALVCLAQLSAAENENWANNATGEFLGLFQLHLGGTEVPYDARLAALDRIWKQGKEHQPLVLKALAKSLSSHEGRTVGAENQGRGPVKPEWRPTAKEAHEARERAVRSFAARVLETKSNAAEVLDIVRSMIWPLVYGSLSDASLESVVESTLKRFPELKEPLRKEFAERVNQREWERVHHPQDVHELPPVVVRMYERLREPGLMGRVVEHVGAGPWDTPEREATIAELARELLGQLEELRRLLPWLTSGDAGHAFALGRAMAVHETRELSAWPLIEGATAEGSDLGLAVGYLSGVQTERGDPEVERLLRGLIEGGGSAGAVAFEAIALLEPSAVRASWLLGLIRSGDVDGERVRRLAHRAWSTHSEDEVFDAFIAALDEVGSPGYRRAALEMLSSRQKQGRQWSGQSIERALRIVTDVDVFGAGGSRRSWGWRQVALELSKVNPRMLAKFLFGRQAESGGSFFLEHDPAAMEVIEGCASADPVAVWEEVARILASRRWSRFSIGFPKALMREFPTADVLDWTAQGKERPGVIGHVVAPIFASDSDLDSRLVELYGMDRGFAGAIFGGLVSGVSWGSLAERFKQQAESLDAVAARTTLAGLRTWARTAADSLRDMELAERGREADEFIRWQ